MLFANIELGSLAIREREADPEDFESRLKSLSPVTKDKRENTLANNSTQSATYT